MFSRGLMKVLPRKLPSNVSQVSKSLLPARSLSTGSARYCDKNDSKDPKVDTNKLNQVTGEYDPIKKEFVHDKLPVWDTTDPYNYQWFEEAVKKDKVVIFIKGTMDQPLCGFSQAVVQVMNVHGIECKAYNVLDEPNLREGVKRYTQWPTIPQVFFEGEFVGGCDILVQMHASGDIHVELKKMGLRSRILEGEVPDRFLKKDPTNHFQG